MTIRLLRLASWLLLAAIAFATLSPLGLRPRAPGPVGMEHFLAFAGVGLLFGLGYPQRLLLAGLLVCSGAVVLEALQFVAPDRHARAIDLLVKLAGGTIGIAVAGLLIMVLARLGHSTAGPVNNK